MAIFYLPPQPQQQRKNIVDFPPAPPADLSFLKNDTASRMAVVAAWEVSRRLPPDPVEYPGVPAAPAAPDLGWLTRPTAPVQFLHRWGAQRRTGYPNPDAFTPAAPDFGWLVTPDTIPQDVARYQIPQRVAYPNPDAFTPTTPDLSWLIAPYTEVAELIAQIKWDEIGRARGIDQRVAIPPFIGNTSPLILFPATIQQGSQLRTVTMIWFIPPVPAQKAPFTTDFPLPAPPPPSDIASLELSLLNLHIGIRLR